jgi:hypothetical protein
MVLFARLLKKIDGLITFPAWTRSISAADYGWTRCESTTGAAESSSGQTVTSSDFLPGPWEKRVRRSRRGGRARLWAS